MTGKGEAIFDFLKTSGFGNSTTVFTLNIEEHVVTHHKKTFVKTRKNTIKKWTYNETQQLQDAALNKIITLATATKFSKQMGRSLDAIRVKANNMGFKVRKSYLDKGLTEVLTPKETNWTKEQTNVLTKSMSPRGTYTSETLREVSRLTGLSFGKVKDKARKIRTNWTYWQGQMVKNLKPRL